MLHLQKQPTGIKNYDPLDLAGDAIWIPIPNSCSSVGVLELYYNIDAAIQAWGVTPVCKKSGAPVLHPDDPNVGKYTLPEGWTVHPHRHAIEWSIYDQNNRRRMTIRYDPEEIVFCCLRTPFDIQTKTFQGTVPPNDWWEEVTHFEKVVFKSETVHPNTPEVVKANQEMADNVFFAQVFLPKLNELLGPQQVAAKDFMTKSFPLFPSDPTAYWE